MRISSLSSVSSRSLANCRTDCKDARSSLFTTILPLPLLSLISSAANVALTKSLQAKMTRAPVQQQHAIEDSSVCWHNQCTVNCSVQFFYFFFFLCVCSVHVMTLAHSDAVFWLVQSDQTEVWVYVCEYVKSINIKKNFWTSDLSPSGRPSSTTNTNIPVTEAQLICRLCNL